jgi:WD40 repeat protein
LQEIGVNALAFSKDGKTLAIACGCMVKLCDMPSGEPRQSFYGGHHETENEIKSIAFHRDGKTIVTLEKFGVKLWDLNSGKSMRPGHSGDGPSALSSDGKTLASAFTLTGDVRVEFDVQGLEMTGWR